jgi:hypothetical protein
MSEIYRWLLCSNRWLDTLGEHLEHHKGDEKVGKNKALIMGTMSVTEGGCLKECVCTKFYHLAPTCMSAFRILFTIMLFLDL